MSQMPQPLADFARQIEALRSVILRLGEDACTIEEMRDVQDLTKLLATCERMEAGLHMMAMRGARSRDIAAHIETVNVADILWGKN